MQTKPEPHSSQWTVDIVTTSTQHCPNVMDVWTKLGRRCNDVACSLGKAKVSESRV